MVRNLRPDLVGMGLPAATDESGHHPRRTETNFGSMDTTPINIGQRLKELDQQIHTCLRDVRRNLAELEKVSDKESEISNGKSGGQFADMLKSSISRRQTPPQSS